MATFKGSIGASVALVAVAFCAQAHAANRLSGKPASKPRVSPLEQDLGGVKSPYTGKLIELARELLGKKQLDAAPAADVELKCWTTPGSDLYVGIEQSMTIQAPLDRVAAVIEDIDRYEDLFPGYKEVKIASREGARLDTFWIQRIPIPFVPNVEFNMLYVLDTGLPDRRAYRYQLKPPADSVRLSDGLIVVHKKDDQTVVYKEYDFFDADWGPAKTFGANKIWSDSVEGIYLSDLAIKLKAENPAWSHKKAQSESKDKMSDKTLETCVKQRRAYPGA